MEVFKKSKWVWINREDEIDVYGEFVTKLKTSGLRTVCRLSCDGDYVLTINGNYVESNQYGDFEHYKIYDEIDVTDFLTEKENIVSIIVWHYGEHSQRYVSAQAGLIFEFLQGDDIVLVSDENILCRKSKVYKNGYKKHVSTQLGFSFLYDARNEADESGFEKAVSVKKNCNFFPRPNKKLKLLDRANAVVVKKSEKDWLIDLTKETVGLIDLNFYSEKEQKIVIAFGEITENNRVRRIIGGNDYSVEYIAKRGENHYTNYMLRLGCRYLEVLTESPIKIDYIGLLPQYYPIQTARVVIENPTDRSIYDLCVETLKLCMMEHYVDCPWREQGLYAFDSRNQMLCGYYAFENGNAEYARSNLKLISQDRRADGLLSICSPCGNDLAIPSFSLYYFLAVKEYVEHTGDIAFVKEIYPKLLSILQPFLNRRKDGLVYWFSDVGYWNFYDWSLYLDGSIGRSMDSAPDFILNALFILALECLKKIDEQCNMPFDYEEILQEERTCIRKAFYNSDNGLFSMTIGGSEYTVLVNAFAILIGIADDIESDRICIAITDGSLSDCSLSMKTFKYDALLAANTEKWKDCVLEEIRRDYGKMLSEGATSAWETIDGPKAFNGSGSLCHGWSAIPIYYYHKLLK